MSRITERRIYAVPSTPFTSDGDATGKFTVTDSSIFLVGQIVFLSSNTQSNLELKIKRILPDGTTVFVGPKNKGIHARTDISAYTTADSATITANEQERPNIPEQEIERVTYEEEPTVARRVILVDKNGCRIDSSNPLPVDATLNVGDIGVDIDAASGDNIAISAHPFQVFDQGSDTITTANFEEIYTYTSSDDKTFLINLDVTVSTQSVIRVKIDGDIIRERRISHSDRNTEFIFREPRPLTDGQVLTVEAKVERLIKASYTSFTSLEGYLDNPVP